MFNSECNDIGVDFWSSTSVDNVLQSPCIMSVQYTRGVQHTGGCSVHYGYHEYSGRYHEYTEGVLSAPGGCHEYSGGYHEYTGGVQYTGGYHEYIGGLP